MFKSTNFIALVFGLLTFTIANSVLADVPWYVIDTTYSPCYQDQFTGCTDCDSAIVTETIIIDDCPCKVTYKISNCNCPEPRTFVEILYIRVDIYFPPPCVALINYVHPNFPTPNMEGYQWLQSRIYETLFNNIFDAVADDYPCETKKKFFYYFEASCQMLCVLGLSAPGHPDAILWLPKYCSPKACCATEYIYCKDVVADSTKREIIKTGGGICDDALPTEPCPEPGIGPAAQPILIDGILYNIIWVNSTECTAVCGPRDL